MAAVINLPLGSRCRKTPGEPEEGFSSQELFGTTSGHLVQSRCRDVTAPGELLAADSEGGNDGYKSPAKLSCYKAAVDGTQQQLRGSRPI